MLSLHPYLVKYAITLDKHADFHAGEKSIKLARLRACAKMRFVQKVLSKIASPPSQN